MRWFLLSLLVLGCSPTYSSPVLDSHRVRVWQYVLLLQGDMKTPLPGPSPGPAPVVSKCKCPSVCNGDPAYRCPCREPNCDNSNCRRFQADAAWLSRMDALQAELIEATSRADASIAELAVTKEQLIAAEKEKAISRETIIDVLAPEPDWRASLQQVMPEHTLLFVTSASCVPCKEARSLVIAPLISAGWSVWVIDSESDAAKDIGADLLPLYVGYHNGVEIGRTSPKSDAQATVNTITGWWGLSPYRTSHVRPNVSAAAPQPPKRR